MITTKLQEVINKLNTNMDLYEIVEYAITETSLNNVTHTYTVYNIEAEIEDGEVYFGDIEGKILTEQYALGGFLACSVKDIMLNDNIIDILFNTNAINIKLIV